MKLNRNMLLTIIAALGVLLITYGLLRHFTGFSLGENGDKYVSDIIIMAALGLFLYNRKLARDEKLAREAAESQAEEAPQEETSEEDEDLPHWERYKNSSDKKLLK